MSAARDPDEVLASIRRLVAREVSDAKEREAQERPLKEAVPVISSRASQAARLILGEDETVAANGMPVHLNEPVPEAGPSQDKPAERMAAAKATNAQDDPSNQLIPESPQSSGLSLSEEELRDLIRDILREEVRTRMGPRINANIRRIVQEELAQLFQQDP